MFKKYRNLWLALGAFIILTPLGLIASGTAFGEWGVDQMEEEVGFIPAGLERMADLWSHAPLADYGIAGFDASFIDRHAHSQYVFYILLCHTLSVLNNDHIFVF